MKTVLGLFIDNTIKRRVVGSYPVYILAKRIVSAFENQDVAMDSNGEAWLLARIAARGAVTALDVGANRGEWVASLVKVAPTARVLCYEPVPTTFASLQSNIFGPNVTLINSGLSSESGELIINSVVDNPYISSIYDVDFYQEGHPIQSIVVPTSTGDAEIAQHGFTHIDIVKVDAEGHDLNVISGFSDAIAKGIVGIFQFEYNQFTLAARRALRDFYTLFGTRYLVCRLLPNGLEACGYHPIVENFGQSNWVAMQRGMIDAAVVKHFSIRAAKGLPGAALAKFLADDTELARLLKVVPY